MSPMMTLQYPCLLHKPRQSDLSSNLHLHASALVYKMSLLLLPIPSLHPARGAVLGSLPRPSSRLHPLFRIHCQLSILLIVVPGLACQDVITLSSSIRATLRLMAPVFQEVINGLALARTFCLIQPDLPRQTSCLIQLGPLRPAGVVRWLLVSLLK